MPLPATPSREGSPTGQLDLFEHSRDTVLRNDALDAVLQRDAAAALAARSALAAFAPGHEALAPLGRLIEALTAAAETAPFTAPGEAAQAAERLEREAVPAAQAQFGQATAAAWLAPLRQRLAERAAGLPFRAAQPEDHAAPLWLRVGGGAAAAAAAQAVAGIPSWWRQPAPLAWMLQARHVEQGLDAAWPLLAELAWLAPERLGAALASLDDALLNRLRRRFENDFETAALPGNDPLAWFPAWLLTEQPALLPRLREARAGVNGAPEQVFRLLVEALGLERQGRQRELIEVRKRLRDRQPALYAAYMQSR
jgi:hypothetical protein